MTQSIARVIASGCGALILIAFGAAVPADALQYCRTAHQFCFANDQAGSACSCADNSGTTESGVVVEAPSSGGSSARPETTAPSSGASGGGDSVDRAGSSSDSSAGSMYDSSAGSAYGGSAGSGYGSSAGSRNSTTTGRELSPWNAPATTSRPTTPYTQPAEAPSVSAPPVYTPRTIAPSAPAALPSPPPAASAQATIQVRTTRSFFGPHDIPPENFAAYGIVAFPQKATPATVRRHQSICEAFLATLPPVSASSAPISQQMVTVWPIDDAALAERLNKGFEAICKQAIDHYDLSTGLIALKEAQNQEHYSLYGAGPYLLAWAPSSQKGQVGSIVLIADLSGATTQEQYLDYFQSWRRDIEQNPQLWPHGWSEAALLILVRNWADKWGTMILSVGHAKSEE